MRRRISDGGAPPGVQFAVAGIQRRQAAATEEPDPIGVCGLRLRRYEDKEGPTEGSCLGLDLAKEKPRRPTPAVRLTHRDGEHLRVRWGEPQLGDGVAVVMVHVSLDDPEERVCVHRHPVGEGQNGGLIEGVSLLGEAALFEQVSHSRVISSNKRADSERSDIDAQRFA